MQHERASIQLAWILSGLLACRASPPDGVPTIPLPDGRPGIGFDDLRYSRALGRVLAPGGRTGNLDLIDPVTRAITAIGGFSEEILNFGGHDQGVTSVDEGDGMLFATDRTTQRLVVVDPVARRIAHQADVASSPDYVRHVGMTHEIWITEPDDDRIEIFTIAGSVPKHDAFIPVAGGPESLVIDATRGRAYTHLWGGLTVAIDLAARTIVQTWVNGCTDGSRGIALDEARGFLLAGCYEGRGSVLDVQTGALLSTLKVGAGVDVIDYNASLGHLYLPGASSATVAIAQVSSSGILTLLGTRATILGAHCVTADDRGNAYVCDPDNGELLVIADPFPSVIP